MSLLDALKSKKTSLRSTETIVTCADGRRFIENGTNVREINANQFGFVVDTKPDNIPALIGTNIYLGSQDCCELSILQNYNIKHVLSIGVNCLFKYDNINYKFVECLDLPDTNIITILSHCTEFIKNAIGKSENILIHCNAGVSRSSAIVIGYLMLSSNVSYDIAYELVKKVRPCVKPNIGFERQLRSLKPQYLL